MITRAYTEGQRSGKPCIDKAWLAAQAEGLIVLSGAHEGDLGLALLSGNLALAEQLAMEYARLFPQRFYIEVQRTGQPFQEDYNHAAIRLA